MRFVDVYADMRAPGLLYSLLKDRPPDVSISHKAMPTEAEHMAFYMSRPYAAWTLILLDHDECAGACYVSKTQEIGIHLFAEYRRTGLGTLVVREILAASSGRMLANINPKNEASIRMFEKLGFKLIQQTYELEAT